MNVDGSHHVARAAAEVGARLVHVSTDLVFDGALGRPYTEDDEPRPVIDYGRQKLAAEEIVRAVLPGALIVRTSLIYGGAEPSRHERLVLEAADGSGRCALLQRRAPQPGPGGRPGGGAARTRAGWRRPVCSTLPARTR